MGKKPFSVDAILKRIVFALGIRPIKITLDWDSFTDLTEEVLLVTDIKKAQSGEQNYLWNNIPITYKN